MNKYDGPLKITLVVALVATGITSACCPTWTGGASIITGIFALLNFHRSPEANGPN